MAEKRMVCKKVIVPVLRAYFYDERSADFHPDFHEELTIALQGIERDFMKEVIFSFKDGEAGKRQIQKMQELIDWLISILLEIRGQIGVKEIICVRLLAFSFKVLFYFNRGDGSYDPFFLVQLTEAISKSTSRSALLDKITLKFSDDEMGRNQFRKLQEGVDLLLEELRRVKIQIAGSESEEGGDENG